MLRSYQSKGVQAVLQSWRSGHRAPLLVSPTGSGKTRMFTAIVEELKGGRVLFLAPWRELVFQAADRLQKRGHQAGILLGGRTPAPTDRVHVTTIQTAARRKLGEYDLVVVDEAHRAVANQAVGILEQYPTAKLLGLTATAIRLDGRPLSRVFDDLVEAATVEELVRQGHLVPSVIYGPREPIDTRQVPIDWSKRDFKARAAAKMMGRPKLVGDFILHWRKHANDQPTWVYCCTLAHAAHVCEQLENSGVRAAVMDGSTSQTQRRELFERQREGDLTALVNVAVLTEGVDYPDLRCVALLRPTLSQGLFLQIVGRGLRPAQGKLRLVVLDHADNVRRHGFPADKQEWSLDGKSKRELRKLHRLVEPKAVQCPFCQALIPGGARTCPACGVVFLPRHVEGMLAQLDPQTVRRRAQW